MNSLVRLTKRHAGLIGWVVVILTHGLATVALAIRHHSIPDENAYLNLAKNIVEHGAFHLDFPAFWHQASEPYTYVAPGWPFALGLGYAAAGRVGCWTVLWLIWCVNSALIFVLARNIGLSLRCQWFAVAWLTLYPIYLFYHGHFMSEPLVITYNLGVMVLAIRFLRRPMIGTAALLGVVSAAGHLTRSQCLLTSVAVWSVAAFTIPRQKWLMAVAVFGVVHLAVVSPWLWRMHQVGGTGVSTELKLGINLYQYSGVQADTYNPEGTDFQFPPGIEGMTPAERDRTLRRAAIDAILADPGHFLQQCFRRSFFLLSPVPNFYSPGRLEYLTVLGASLAFFHLPLLAVLAGLIRRRPLGPAGRLLLTAVVVWYAFHIAMHASIRQRLPSDPWVLLLALILWRGLPTGSPPEVPDRSRT